MPPRRSLLRQREHDQHEKVTSVELFFDLVFVFAITQLSHSLAAHFDLLGAAKTLLLTLGVWWVWIYTSWVTNWLDPEKIPTRLLLLALMLTGLVMSASIPEAFGERAIPFACAYVAMQVGRTLYFLWAVAGHDTLVANYRRILVWLLLSAAFWLAGAWNEPLRLPLWLAAIAIEFVSPSLGFFVPGLGRSRTRDWDIEGGHLSERCGLFVIIALGESILVTGATFAKSDWNAAVCAAFVCAFVASLAMWWIYFDAAAERGTERIVSTQDPGRLARLTYTYVHLVIVAGIVLSAVGDEFVLAHPLDHDPVASAAAVLGGAALYLCGNALFKWSIARRFSQPHLRRLPRSHLVGIALLALPLPVLAQLPPLALSAIAASVLLGVAIWEARNDSGETPADPVVELDPIEQDEPRR